MTEAPTSVAPSARRLPNTPTLVLIAAGLVAAASAGVAIYRSGGEAPAAEAPHGSVKPGEPVPDVTTMIAKLEARLRQNPDDPADWRMLGWSYFETGDLMRAAAAYRRAAEIEPGKAENWSSLGEALQTASTDVSPEAATAFERALRLDPEDPRARYFLAVQKDLKGQHEAAVSDWIALLKDTPAGAPWEADLRRTIEQVAEKRKIDIAGRMPAAGAASAGSVATAAIPGPTPQQMAAASSIPPGQQSEMVRGMVDRLAARLKANPQDAAGWIRLMRARMVLGESDGARKALRSARAAYSGDPAVQAQLSRAAQELGVPSG
jgi:cytochrome c-type biogenesis protein CcmH